MVDLDVLRVADLKKLAKECKIKLKGTKKAEFIKQIASAGIKEDRLKELVDKYEKKKGTTKTKAESSSKLENRVYELEQQMRFMMKKIDDMDAKLSSKEIQPISLTEYDISNIKKKLISLIPKGDSKTIDEILKVKTFKKIPYNLFEQAIVELIDEEIFDGAAGRSQFKVDDTIGRIIRR